jgi:hypothetical protein
MHYPTAIVVWDRGTTVNVVILEKEQLLLLVSVFHPLKHMDVSLLRALFDYEISASVTFRAEDG